MTDAKTGETMEQRAQRIAGMFDQIAPTYDLLNRVLSFGLDRRWRALALQAGAPRATELWLDLASGSGDMALAGNKLAPASLWYAADPSRELLRRLRKKTPPGILIPAMLARAEKLPFRDKTFDGATVAFGVRNFADIAAGLRELARVLKPEARLVILEFHPRQTGHWGSGPLVKLYLERLIPLIGWLVSGQHRAYKYLAESSREFLRVEELAGELRDAGFSRVQWQSVFARSVILTRAIR